MKRSILIAVFCSLFAVLNTGFAQSGSYVITSLGRIEPNGGIIELAGPSGASAVISQLNVEEGDQVAKGQVLAILDSYAKRKADIDRLQAILENAERKLARQKELSRKSVTSETKLDDANLDVQVAKADIAIATAELEQAQIISPIDGQILEIHAYPGERIGDNGVLELGQTKTMYVVAEIYETDIGKIRVGQTATINSDALSEELTGTVERIGLKIGKKDVFDTDPVAKADARVIETYILLNNSEAVARYTNLQVEVSITP
jgi:HlyD family secretion protein